MSHVLRKCAVEKQMAAQPEHLRQHNANGLRSCRHLDPCHLLYRHDIGQIIHDPTEVIDAVGIGNIGVPGLALSHLFGTAMVVTNIRDRINENFAVQLQGYPECTMHTGMVGTEIQKHEIRIFRLALHAPFFGLE